MACIPLPKVTLPTLPGGLTFGASLPSLSLDADLCCKALPFPIAIPPIPLPPATINPAAIAIVTQTMAQIQAFVNSLSIPCPKE